MEITLTQKQIDFLKKILNKEDIQPTIQKVVDDWLKHLVETKYQSTRTLEQKIDELSE